jgi:hypothetical protein
MALIKAALSAERFDSHRLASDETDERVFLRYQWNAEVSECYYAPLRVLEVVLRNRFDLGVAANFRNPDWLLAVPGWLGETGQQDVRKAHAYLAERGREVTQARMVQEMSFGFWTSLLNGRYESLFHALGARVFPGLPRAMRTRANASRRFESIRLLRNRIFHFRRIWNRPDLAGDFDRIVEAIHWVDPRAGNLLLPVDARNRLHELLQRRP